MDARWEIGEIVTLHSRTVWPLKLDGVVIGWFQDRSIAVLVKYLLSREPEPEEGTTDEC